MNLSKYFTSSRYASNESLSIQLLTTKRPLLIEYIQTLIGGYEKNAAHLAKHDYIISIVGGFNKMLYEESTKYVTNHERLYLFYDVLINMNEQAFRTKTKHR